MNNNNNNDQIMAELYLMEISSSEEFAIDILTHIHQSINDNKYYNPCLLYKECGCKTDEFIIHLSTDKEFFDDESYIFNYSLSIGFYPFQQIESLYLKLSERTSIFIIISTIGNNCMLKEYK